MGHKLTSCIQFLLISSIVMPIVGCNAGAGQIQGNLERTLPLPPQREVPAPTTIVHFVAKPTTSPSSLSDGAFIDKQHAWVNDAGELKFTTDGGLSWLLAHPNLEDERFFGRIGATYVRPYFVTPARGWLNAGSGVWQTEDGGLTWRRIFAEVSTMKFADAQNGWINVWVSETSQQSYITRDSGQTWQPCGSVRSKDRQLPANVYFLTTQSVWAITTRTVDRQIIYGVARSDDGGCQWQQLWASDDSTDERYNDIYFLTDREGWLAGEFSLYRTTDGGKTWRQRSLPFAFAKITDVYFTNSNDGWIVAANMESTEKSMYRTSDCGKSWRKMINSELTNTEIPSEWQGGKLFQMLYISKAQ